MGQVNSAYGSNGQALTITLTSLASGNARESASIDNTGNLFLDALVQVKFKLAATASASDKALYAYVAASVDNGTTWPDEVTGADAAITPDTPANLRLLGAVYVTGSAGATWKGGPFSVAAAFGGSMPAKWSVVILNKTGCAFTAVGGDHVVQYQGVYGTTT